MTRNLSDGFYIPWNESDQDSYWADLFGLLAILSVVHSLVRIVHLQEAYLKIACSRKGVLLQQFKDDKPAQVRNSEWDALALAQKICVTCH